MRRLKEAIRLDGRVFPVLVIAGVVLLLLGRYLAYGVPHEFITGEYKGTFEGDYDFTLELVRTFSAWWRLPLWSDTYSGPVAVFASNIHVFEQALLFPLTHSLSLSIKILQALQFLVAGLGMYCLSNYLFRDRVAAVFSAVLYMFSPFYIGHLLSYLHYTGVYLLGPLVFYLILRTIDERSVRLALILSVVAVYSLLSHPQNVFIGGIFYALFFILVAVHGFYDSLADGEGRIFLRHIVSISVVIVAASALLSAFTVWPTLADSYPYLRTSWVKGAEGLVHVDHGHIGSHSQSLLATITMQHWPWLQTPLKGGEFPPWNYMAVYLMPFVFTSVSLLIRFNWITLVLIVLTVLSVQTAEGVRGHPDLFTLASKYLPFFGMSRTPYAYVNTALMVLCLLPSVTFIWLCRRLEGLWEPTSKKCLASGAPGRAASPLMRWLLFAALVVPYLFAARYYGNDYNWTFISAKQPEYLSSVWGWMDRNNDTRGRVIETCGIPTAMILGQRMLPNQVDLLERFRGKDYLDDYLALMGFRYVISPSLHSQRNRTFDVRGYMPPSVFDRGEGMNEYYSALTTEYYHIYERLSADPGFTLHTAGTRDVAIFENRSAFGGYELYPARALMVLGGTEAYDILNLPEFHDRNAAPGETLLPAPVFVAQSENLARLDEIRSVSTDLVFHNTDALDLNVLLNREAMSVSRPTPDDPEYWSLAIYSFGIQQPFPAQDHSIGNSLYGEMTFADYAITSQRAGSSVAKRFDITEGGRYRVMLRSYGGREFSDLAVSIDNAPVGIVGQKSHSGYAWLTLLEGELSPGRHTVDITLTEDHKVYIDSIAVVRAASIADGISTAVAAFDGAMSTYIINHRKFRLDEGAGVATATVTTGVPATYRPGVRLARHAAVSAGGKVSLLIDGDAAGEVDLARLTGSPEVFALPDRFITGGEHTIALAGLVDGVYFDLVSLSERPGMGESDAEAALSGFSFERSGPSRYSLKLSGVEPGKNIFLVFNETNYPGWRMQQGGERHRPVIANMFMNGFIVRPENGQTDAVIMYSNTAQRAGVLVSALTLIVVIAAGIGGWRRLKG